MTIFDSIVLGIIEGITEFLPISSTGHLILGGKVLGLAQTEFLKSFEITIQLGAILAVLFLYWGDFLIFKNIKRIAVGTIPTAFVGFGLYGVVKEHLLGSSTIVLWALFLGGIFLIIFEMFYRGPDVKKEKPEEITFLQAFFIGIFQCLAIIPGVSRSAATIIGGLSLGIPRKTIVEFSFILAVPIIAGSAGLDILKNPTVFQGENLLPLVIGFLVSFLVAIFSIKFLLRFVEKHNFVSFGIYRIIISLLFFLVIF